MNTRRYALEVSGIRVEVVCKRIKHLHLSVCPPDGHVRVAAPLRLDEEAVRLAVVTRLGWIRHKQKLFQAQPRQSARSYVSGESHYVAGQRYLLDVVEHDSPPKMCLVNNNTLEMRVRPDTSHERRQMLLNEWYRARLRVAVPPLIAKWETVVGVTLAEWRIKRMKTRWGTCNIQARRIWLNLELAKYSPACLEYIIVHEMTHLLERRHNDRFRALMDKFLPQWRLLRDELNRGPIGEG